MMRQYSLQVLCSLCLSVLLTASVLLAENSPTQKDLKNIQARIESQLKTLEKQSKEKTTLLQNLEFIEKKQSKLTTSIRSTNQKISAHSASIKQLKTDKQRLVTQKHKLEKQIEGMLFSVYRLSRESKIKVFLNQQSTTKISRALLFSQYIKDSHHEALVEFQQTIKKITAIELNLQTEITKNTKQHQFLSKEKQAISSAIEERKQLLHKLNQKISTNEQKLKTLKADQQRLKALVKAVERSLADIKIPTDVTPFSKMQRRLIKPSEGKIDKRFGRYIEHTQLKWQGVAFISPIGKSVRSVHYGRVVFSGWFRGKGLLLIIDHGEAYMTLYAHNETLRVETGDWVKQGDIIATVGSSGGLDHSELYFEIRHKGEALNPKKWFR